MRPFEILLFLADLAIVFAFVLPLAHGAIWRGCAEAIALASLFGHLGTEGTRWQMVPAYAVTIVLLALVLIRVATKVKRPQANRWHL